jgi:hypothetical protein
MRYRLLANDRLIGDRTGVRFRGGRGLGQLNVTLHNLRHAWVLR